MLSRHILFVGLITATLCGVEAEVVDKDANGFVSEHTLQLPVTPDVAYAALVNDVALWWDASHSFGGSAAAFSIEDRAGGCFCERNGDVEVEHLRVVNVARGKSITFIGGLGPLQSMAVTGSMSFTFSPVEGGSELIYQYSVGGYLPGGLEVLAEPVDRVQLGQLERLKRYLETGVALNK